MDFRSRSNETVIKNGKTILTRPDKEDETDSERLTQTHLEQVNANQRFREISTFLNSIRYLHVIPLLMRDSDRLSTRKDLARDPFGSDFLEQIARTPKRILESRLRRIRKALTVAVPQLRDLELDRDELGTPHLSGRFQHWRPNAGWQREDQFSDGTLRLLGLLWAVIDGSGPLLLEEPELSLHPSVVRFIPQMLWKASRSTKKRRQIFLSTHSPELLSDKGIAPDESLLIYPDKEGSVVDLASNNQQILSLLEGGQTIAEAVLPRVAPKRPDQLVLL